MAFTVTSQGEAVQGFGTSVTVSSFTPTANTLLIAKVVAEDTSTIDSITGHGTWTLIDSDISSNSYRHEVYALIIGGSPSAAAVSVGYTPAGTGAGAALHIIQIQGANVSGTAAAAVVQNSFLNAYLGGTPATYSDTLASFASATNLCLVLPYDREEGGIDPESGYSELAGTRLSVCYKAAEDTTPSCDFTGGSGNFYPGMHSLEIAQEAGDTTPPTFTSGPTVTATSSTGHTISLTPDENCTIYGVRLASGASAPSSAQVKAGQDAASSAAPEAKNSAAASGVAELLTFSTGSLATTYDYYFVAEDTATNLQASPTALTGQATEAGTLSITGGVLTFGAAFNFQYTGFSAITSTMTIGPDSQGNTLNVAVTDNGPDPATCTGTMPALPASGSAARILVENGLTVTITEA